MIFNRLRRWSHSSRVELPLVSMSASCFLVSTYMIWILGSKLMLSNNQSSSTLWVVDTCLIVGLLPSMIILITASLSSNVYNCPSDGEEVAFLVAWSRFDNCSTFWLTFVWAWICDSANIFLLLDWCCSMNVTLLSPHRINQVRVNIHARTCIQRHDFWFCGTVRYRRLFLAHPTFRNKCSTSKDT